MIASAYNMLTIRSPEGLTFSIRLAGPLTRFLAWCIDVGAISVLLFATNLIASLLALANVDLAFGFYIAFNFGIVLAYPIMLEWFWGGQTVGKRVLGLRVMDERGLRLSIEQVVLRNLLRVVDRLPIAYFVGATVMTVSARNQRLGDVAAGTIVAFTTQRSLPQIENITGGKYNSLRHHPHLEARLRKLCPPEAASIAIEALDRRDELEPGERVKLFSDLAHFFRTLVPFPDSDVLGVADEQYVQNVIDSLYNTPGHRSSATRREAVSSAM